MRMTVITVSGTPAQVVAAWRRLAEQEVQPC